SAGRIRLIGVVDTIPLSDPLRGGGPRGPTRPRLHARPRALFGRPGWADQRRADRPGHPVEHHDALTRTERRERFGDPAENGVEVLPVVTHPHVPGRIDGNVNL